MKIVITFLILLQLTIVGIIGITGLRALYINQLLYSNRTEVEINFDDIDQYHDFMALMLEKDIIVSRLVWTDFDQFTLYTTDLTFNGIVELNSGDWPAPMSDEFISNETLDDPDQVGKIDNITPRFTVMIRNLDEPRHFGINGIYQLHTVDDGQLWEIERFLMENTYFATIRYQAEGIGGIIGFLAGGLFNATTVTETALVITIPLVTFICLIFSLIQYSMDQLKKGSIGLFHGVSKRRIIALSLIEMIKSLFTGIIVAYIIVMIYTIIAGFAIFITPLTGYFVAVSLVLIVVYALIVIFTLSIIFMTFQSYVTIKGFKPDFMIQIFNHVLKAIFVSCFLIAVQFTIVNLNDLNMRRNNLNHWEMAREIYNIPISYLTYLDLALEFYQTSNLLQFFDQLSVNHQAFLMDSREIEIYEMHGITAMRPSGLTPPWEIDPYGNRIDICLNYLLHNPIETAYQLPIYDQMIWDDFVINLLVPLSLAEYEYDIITLYLEHFYWQGLNPRNSFNSHFELPLIDARKDDLSVNIIYVYEGQTYFSFNPRLSPETGNNIIDPIAVVHTGNFYFTFMNAIMSTGMYFRTEELNPFDVLEPLLAEYDLTYMIRTAQSVFAKNGELIANLEADMARSFVIIVVLILTSITVSYNLIANYFWRHKYILFTKRLFGVGLIKRNQWFILSFLGYQIPLIVAGSFIFGITVFVIGILSLMLELIVILLFERRLQEKSFASIVKGEH